MSETNDDCHDDGLQHNSEVQSVVNKIKIYSKYYPQKILRECDYEDRDCAMDENYVNVNGELYHVHVE